MLLGGTNPIKPSELDLLARKRAIDSHRKAQAILRRRHATSQAMSRIVAANQRAAQRGATGSYWDAPSAS